MRSVSVFLSDQFVLCESRHRRFMTECVCFDQLSIQIGKYTKKLASKASFSAFGLIGIATDNDNSINNDNQSIKMYKVTFHCVLFRFAT